MTLQSLWLFGYLQRKIEFQRHVVLFLSVLIGQFVFPSKEQIWWKMYLKSQWLWSTTQPSLESSVSSWSSELVLVQNCWTTWWSFSPLLCRWEAVSICLPRKWRLENQMNPTCCLLLCFCEKKMMHKFYDTWRNIRTGIWGQQLNQLKLAGVKKCIAPLNVPAIDGQNFIRVWSGWCVGFLVCPFPLRHLNLAFGHHFASPVHTVLSLCHWYDTLVEKFHQVVLFHWFRVVVFDHLFLQWRKHRQMRVQLNFCTQHTQVAL